MAVVGVDLGTQSLKAVVVDEALKLRGEGAVDYLPHFTAPGRAEQHPALWLAALQPAIGKALAAAGRQPADINGIGVVGQLDGCVPTDTCGRALSPCIIWMDRRAEAEIGGFDADRVRQRTGLVLDAGHMAAKIRWLQRHELASRQCRRWHQPVSFVVQALCGRAVMDHALASTTMLYGLEECDYGDDLLAMFDVERESLPEIDDAAAPAGALSAAGAALTGLPAGITVAVGTGDDFANPIGAAVVKPGVVSCSVGTGEGIGVVSDALRLDHQALVETHGFLDRRFYIGNPGWLAGGAVTWFRSTFSVGSPAEVSMLAGCAAPGSDDLLFLPALSGAMAPRWVPGARGAFYGLTAFHDKAACARALLEGCAFAMRDVVERLGAMGLVADRIRLSGGGAKSRVWSQIRADVCQRPVEVVGAADASPLGAAVLASVAAGEADDVADAASQLLGPVETIEPCRSNAALYDRGYHRYRALFDALSPVFGAA
jgi:xylulokinase